MNEKNILFLILLLSIKLVTSQYKPVKCGGTDTDKYEISYYYCSEGTVDADEDNLGYKPDTCCYADASDSDCDDGHCSYTFNNFCIQMKKDKIDEYIPFLLNVFKTCFTLQCDSDYCNEKCACPDSEYKYCGCFYKSNSSYVKVIELFFLFLLLLL